MRLDVTDLVCRRSGRLVLDGVGLSIGQGEVLALRGPNGSGKSTLLRVLAGLLPAESGGVVLDGTDLRTDPDRFLARIAYAGHLDAIKPQMTVRENLTFWARLFGAGAADAALEAFDLGAIAERPAHACSAGQKRRLGLARLALVRDRPLWLLDEPTVSLDAGASALLFDAVRAHCAQGGAAIIATHIHLDLPLASALVLEPVGKAGSGAGGQAGRAVDPFLEDLLE